MAEKAPVTNGKGLGPGIEWLAALGGAMFLIRAFFVLLIGGPIASSAIGVFCFELQPVWWFWPVLGLAPAICMAVLTVRRFYGHTRPKQQEG
jgi:hypothetical protein